MDYTILILVLPVLSFLVLGLTGMFMKHRVAGLIGTASLLGVTILSYLTAFKYFMSPRTADGVYPTLTPWNIEWLPFTDALHIDMGILLDPISVMMLVVISTVSLMVHIYSFGYMPTAVRWLPRTEARTGTCLYLPGHDLSLVQATLFLAE